MGEHRLIERDKVLVRRQTLEAGEATPWHVDPYARVTIVLSGTELSIEYRDGGAADRVAVAAGQTDWDEPALRPHRAVNLGPDRYEEVTVFFLDKIGAEAQPIVA